MTELWQAALVCLGTFLFQYFYSQVEPLYLVLQGLGINGCLASVGGQARYRLVDDGFEFAVAFACAG